MFEAKLRMTHLLRVRLCSGTIVPGPLVQETFFRATYCSGTYLSGAR